MSNAATEAEDTQFFSQLLAKSLEREIELQKRFHQERVKLGSELGWSLKEVLDRAVDDKATGKHPVSSETAPEAPENNCNCKSNCINGQVVCTPSDGAGTNCLEALNPSNPVDEGAQCQQTVNESKPASEPYSESLTIQAPLPKDQSSSLSLPLLVYRGPTIQPAIPESLSHLHSNLEWSNRKIQSQGMGDNGPGKAGMSPRELRRKELTRKFQGIVEILSEAEKLRSETFSQSQQHVSLEAFAALLIAPMELLNRTSKLAEIAVRSMMPFSPHFCPRAGGFTPLEQNPGNSNTSFPGLFPPFSGPRWRSGYL